MVTAVSKTAGKRVGDGSPGPGRPKGKPNKVTHDLRQMVLAALDKAGGQAYLQKQANENPVAFMSMLGKCIPKDINVEGALQFTVTVQRLTDQAK